MTRKFSRREMLRLAVSTGLAAGVTRVIGVRDAAASVVAPRRARQSGSGSVATIGRRYLQLTPKESAARKLRSLLPPDAIDQSGTIVWSVIARASDDDFARGEIVTIDGWRLAKAEARAAAYAVVKK